MFIRDSRRSYRTYSYAELILITDLCAFRTPVGVTELILVYMTYSYLTDLILVLQNLLLYFGYRSTRRYYRTDSLYGGTRRYHWTYTYLTDTGVLIGTTELVLIY